MKHQYFRAESSDQPVLHMTDEEAEARVFQELEAQQLRLMKKNEGVVIFQFPDTRTFLQRVSAWWYLSGHRAKSDAMEKTVEVVIEPIWRGHWATVKYL